MTILGSLLIDQAAHGRMAGIIVLTAWPSRGIVSLMKMAGTKKDISLYSKINIYKVR